MMFTGFEAPVVPGMLCASLFPAIIGSKFPRVLYLTQTLKFRHSALVRHKAAIFVHLSFTHCWDKRMSPALDCEIPDTS